MYKSDYAYAASRLVGTIVMYRSSPVEVINIDFDDGDTEVVSLITGNKITTHLDKLNLSPIRLGYVEINGIVRYLARVPKREDWRQGIRSNNLNFRVENDSIVKCIKGDYKSFNSQVGKKSFCWCRDWAITLGSLFYKGIKVGSYNPNKDAQPILDKGFEFLSGDLECSVN